MPSLNQDKLEAAMAPGVAKAKEICETVANDMAGGSADEIHAELVRRLQAEPFEWDDERLQELAASISGSSPASGDAGASSDPDRRASDEDAAGAPTPPQDRGRETDDQSDFSSQPVDPDAGSADAGANPGDHEGGAGDASPSPAEGVTGGAPES